MSLKWFQRLFLKEVTGRVKKKIYGFTIFPAIPPMPKGYPFGIPAEKRDSTFYEIEDEKGNIHFAGMWGHQPSLSAGDVVEMCISKDFGVATETRYVTGPNNVRVKKEIFYGEIKRFKVLQPKPIELSA